MLSTDAANPDPRYRGARRAFMVAAIAMAAILLLSIVAAFVAGGRFGELENEMWDAAIEWPVVPLPWFVPVSVSLVPPVAAIALAATARRQDRADLVYFLVLTVVLFGLVPFVFARWHPMDGGVPFDGDAGLGLHWLGVPVQLVTVLAIAAGLLLATRRGAGADASTPDYVVEVDADQDVWLQAPFEYPSGQWRSPADWIAHAAAHADRTARDLRLSRREWRQRAGDAAGTKLRTPTTAAAFWAFGVGGDPVTIARIDTAPRTAIGGGRVDDLAANGRPGGADVLMRETIADSRLGSIASIAWDAVFTVGRHQHHVVTARAVGELDGVVVVAELTTARPEHAVRLAPELVRLVAGTRTIRIREDA